MAGNGPILVLAGPGSGKTRVLTQRIVYLIEELRVQPRSILAVTFTNKAALEMEKRVKDMLADRAYGVTLGTFHAICARILRREAEKHLPFKSNFVIFDQDDQVNLAKQAIKDLNLDDKRYRPTGVHAAISKAKNDLILPENFPVQTYRDEIVKRVFVRYQDLLIANNALDFDDLLVWTAQLLETNQEVREKYARWYEHVLVDEFQDTNLAQYILIKHLSSFHHNIFCVGDSDQSIYRWRGADYRNVRRFERDYPDTQVILLEQNYRSVQSILDVAMEVIDRNPHRTRKQLFTERGEGQKVILHPTPDDRVEAAYVVDTIASMVARGQAKPGDFAVMYRTNAQSRLLEEAFLHASLPYKLVGAQRFYGRREIKDIIAYLRLVHNPDDEFSLSRILGVPPRGIGDKTYQLLRQQAQRQKLSTGRLLLEFAAGKLPQLKEVFPGRTGTSLSNFSLLLSSWHSQARGLPPLSLMDRIMEDINYHGYINDGTDEGLERWENVMELRRLASEFTDTGLELFLERVALVSDQDTVDTNANVPTLLTLHAAKGLEFPVVFIVGLDDGTLPHQRAIEDDEELMEERRLFYVGITRAQDRLFLVYPQHRSSYGYAEPVEPSRFLRDITQEFLHEEGVVRNTVGRKSSFRPDRWDSSTSTRTQRVVQQQYSPGMRVIHPVWGEGMVLNSRLQDDDEIVDIYFEQMGLKRVAASLAKLAVKDK